MRRSAQPSRWSSSFLAAAGLGRGKGGVCGVHGVVVSVCERGGSKAWPEATGEGASCVRAVVVAMPVMASSGGAGATRSGLCSDDLDPGKAWS